MEKKEMSKKLYVAVSVVLSLAVAFAVYAVKADLFGKKAEVSDEVLVTYSLSVTAHGESIYNGDVTAAQGTVLIDSMTEELEKEGIEVIYENGEYGAFITAIGGHAQSYDENLYWTFTLNGEMTMEGASDIIPADGDAVVFTLEEIVW